MRALSWAVLTAIFKHHHSIHNVTFITIKLLVVFFHLLQYRLNVTRYTTTWQ